MNTSTRVPRWVFAIAPAALLLAGCATGPAPVAPSDGALDPDVQAEWGLLHGQFPEVAQPDVDIVRRIDRADWAVTIAGCLNESGFPDVTASPDNGLDYQSAGAQQEAFAVAKYICVAQYPLETKYTTPLDDEQLGGLFDYLTTVQVPCLEARGYPISAPPSRQRFIETYATAPEWLPYGDLPAEVFQSDKLEELQVECPEEPPQGSEYYLY